MSQIDIDHVTSNENNNVSTLSSDPQPITWTNSSFTPIHKTDKLCIISDSTLDSDTQNLSSSNYNNNTEDDNIDWEYVTKQLETKLQTSSADILQSQSDESYHTKLPPKIPKKYRFRPITNHESTVSPRTLSTTTTSPNDDNVTLHSVLLHKKPTIMTKEDQLISNQNETDTSTFDHTSTLHELFHQLIVCQKKQSFLLKQIEQLINEPEQSSSSLPTSIPSPSTFFLPLNSFNSNDIPSLQGAFQQRKSSFIQQSKKRVNDIYRQNNKYHHRIIPDIKQTNNTYLQERRQYENDRLCAMIIKHQNRQNAKIYGNLIKNQLCHN